MARPKSEVKSALESILSEPIPQNVMAWLVGVTPGRVSQLVTDGTLRKGESGIQWLHSYCEHQRAVAAGHQSAEPGGLDPIQEGAALKRVQRERIELQNAATRGELAPIELLGDALSKVVEMMVSELEQIDGAIAKAAPDMPERAKLAALSCVVAARNKIAAAAAKGISIGDQSETSPDDDVDDD